MEITWSHHFIVRVLLLVQFRVQTLSYKNLIEMTLQVT